MADKEEFRHIVRIASKDLNGNLPVYRALTKIKGIGIRMARSMATVFEKETKVAFDSKLGAMPEDMDKKLEDIVLFPGKHGIPGYCLNRQRDLETGQDKHQVMADLDFQLRTDLQRLNKIKSYRGLRLSWGLPVRGQRTKSTHRGKGSIVGVTKKDAKAGGASQPAKKAEPAKKPQAGKKK